MFFLFEFEFDESKSFLVVLGFGGGPGTTQHTILQLFLKMNLFSSCLGGGFGGGGPGGPGKKQISIFAGFLN